MNLNILLLGIIGCFCNILMAQEFKLPQREIIQFKDISVEVTFECQDCKTKNKFSVSGSQEFTFEKVIFPMKRRLAPGEYKMTYWQNRVQQIHLPFIVKPSGNNVIKVK